MPHTFVFIMLNVSRGLAHPVSAKAQLVSISISIWLAIFSVFLCFLFLFRVFWLTTVTRCVCHISHSLGLQRAKKYATQLPSRISTDYWRIFVNFSVARSGWPTALGAVRPFRSFQLTSRLSSRDWRRSKSMAVFRACDSHLRRLRFTNPEFIPDHFPSPLPERVGF